MFDGPMIGYVHTEVRNSMFLFTLLYSYIVKVLLKPQTTVLRPRYRFWNSLTVFKQWFLRFYILVSMKDEGLHIDGLVKKNPRRMLEKFDVSPHFPMA
jgi:hypothetical protein